jgi:hypothetical protein
MTDAEKINDMCQRSVGRRSLTPQNKSQASRFSCGLRFYAMVQNTHGRRRAPPNGDDEHDADQHQNPARQPKRG